MGIVTESDLFQSFQYFGECSRPFYQRVRGAAQKRERPPTAVRQIVGIGWGGPAQLVSTIFPIWALVSISACAAAASRSGKVL
jgi:hypothetical protein